MSRLGAKLGTRDIINHAIMDHLFNSIHNLDSVGLIEKCCVGGTKYLVDVKLFNSKSIYTLVVEAVLREDHLVEISVLRGKNLIH